MTSSTQNSLETLQEFFNEWEIYQALLDNNGIYHQEMFAKLHQLLKKMNMPFTLLDLGCGDASFMAKALQGTLISHYTGIDIAEIALNKAKEHLNILSCEKSFFLQDMFSGIDKTEKSFDIIFLSYALHHLTTEDKIQFINHAKKHLNSHGKLILVDSFRQKNQTREQWIEKFNHYINTRDYLSEIYKNAMCNHVKECDFPEPFSTYEDITHTQGWKHFSIPLEIEMYAMMIFES